MPKWRALGGSWKKTVTEDPWAPARIAWRELSPPLSRWLGQPLAGPVHATFIPTYQCDLRCGRCGLKQRVRLAQMDGMEELSVTQVERVIDDLAAMRTGELSLSGGEPLLCRDTLHYLRYARCKGLSTQLATNGLLVDDAMADAIVETGVSAVEIPVDGVDADTHDGLRGRGGAFDKALSALRRLSERKREGKPKLIAVSVLCQDNVGQLPHIAERVASWGADRYNVIPEHRFDLSAAATEMSLPLPRELRQTADRALEELMAVHKQTGVMDCSMAYLKLLKCCIRGEPVPVPCYAGYVTYVVDCYGQLFPCLGMLQQGRRGANVRDLSVRRHWHSAGMAQTRQNLRDCRRCYWNCKTEPDFLYSLRAWMER